MKHKHCPVLYPHTFGSRAVTKGRHQHSNKSSLNSETFHSEPIICDGVCQRDTSSFHYLTFVKALNKSAVITREGNVDFKIEIALFYRFSDLNKKGNKIQMKVAFPSPPIWRQSHCGNIPLWLYYLSDSGIERA